MKYLISTEDETLSDEKSEEALNLEKQEQKKGTYKRADLLKMHAYKDAIRRTAGAYILYPGTDVYRRQGFHEIIPGLGAFPIAPSAGGEDMGPLREFLKEVVDHFADRASQREAFSYHQYDIHKNSPVSQVNDKLPEMYNGSRAQPLSEISILVGYYRKNQYPWIKKYSKYNIRVGKKEGLADYSAKAFGAKYLLLYGRDTHTSDLWRIIEPAPQLITKNELKSLNYPGTPGSKNYLMFSLELVPKKEFGYSSWDVSRLKGFKKNSYQPFTANLAELITIGVQNR